MMNNMIELYQKFVKNLFKSSPHVSVYFYQISPDFQICIFIQLQYICPQDIDIGKLKHINIFLTSSDWHIYIFVTHCNIVKKPTFFKFVQLLSHIWYMTTWRPLAQYAEPLNSSDSHFPKLCSRPHPQFHINFSTSSVYWLIHVFHSNQWKFKHNRQQVRRERHLGTTKQR